jgi:hypothetical protein
VHLGKRTIVIPLHTPPTRPGRSRAPRRLRGPGAHSTWGLPTESAIRKLKMNTLTGILELSRITSAALESELNRPDLPAQERQELFRRWDAVVRDSHAAQLELAILEQAEREAMAIPTFSRRSFSAPPIELRCCLIGFG